MAKLEFARKMVGLFRRTRSGEYSTPRTVLGFYAAVLAILEAGVIAAIAVLATQESLRYLVPYVLVFGAAVLLCLIALVAAMNLIDPTKLQLGRVTGREFIEYQRLSQGDSLTGDQIVSVGAPLPGGPPHTSLTDPAARALTGSATPLPSLPAGEREKSESEEAET